MNKTQTNRPRLLFLFSDTGGGHRSAAEAIIEALHLEYGDAFSIEMVDIFKDYAPRPLNLMPDWYPAMARMSRAWGWSFRLSNGHARARLLTASTWPYVRRASHAMVAQHPSDLIVSVHPLAAAPVLRALKHKPRPPYITVVTDLVSTHALWYHHFTDLCIVPTEAAKERALKCGLAPEQVTVVGLPVADRFCHPVSDRQALRARLGWPQDRKIVLLVGGGEGMGPLEQTAKAVAQGCPNAALVVVSGRNEKLKARLEAEHWPIPTLIYGFVREMPDFMRAADVLVTKAGPGTISESLIAGLPLVLYSRLPGQEDGNVAYVVSEGAGRWAPQPDEIVYSLNSLLNNPAQYARAVAACQRLARPHAARQIARILASQLQNSQDVVAKK